jgi:hypothetical protein
MRLPENLGVMVLSIAVLAQGIFAVTHCFEQVSRPAAARLAQAADHDDDCEWHAQSSPAVVAAYEFVKAVPVAAPFGEFISKAPLASRGAAPDVHETPWFFPPPLSLNSVLRI